MFLLQSTFYALQIVFILSISDFALGRPYFPGIGISVTHPTQIESQFGLRHWNDYDDDVSNKFGSPDDVDDIKDDDMDISKVLKAIQDQWQQMENTVGVVRNWDHRRGLKYLRLF